MDVSLLCIQVGTSKESKIVIQEQSSSHSRTFAVENTSAAKSAEILTLFRNDLAKESLREFLGYEPRTKDGSYV